jgi:ergothioneine biosynthesis protein EgtB
MGKSGSASGPDLSPLLGKRDTSPFDAYVSTRRRTAGLFNLLNEAVYYEQPIPLRHPIVFYEGHLPAFSFNTLVKRGLGRASIDARLEALFARGIDPDESRAGATPAGAWPSRDDVRAFVDEADSRVLDALAHAELERPGDPLLDRAEAVHAILEHEEMHQETMLYMWHQLPFGSKRRPSGYAPVTAGEPPRQRWIRVPAGRPTLGVDAGDEPFSWDNERPSHVCAVAAFDIQEHDVTNAEFLEFLGAGGYQDTRWWDGDAWTWIAGERRRHPMFWEREGDAWFWRGMFDRIPLPPAWPAYVSHAEASAYARWRGARLPTEAEFQRAAYGTPDERAERRHPWGGDPPSRERGVFDFESWDPQPAGGRPAGRSAWGIQDLVGNGWEWTSTVFAPFPGFAPLPSYPQYSADFFDGQHFVMKGASPATARELIRPTFRNWFRPRYPYVYATFRCARDVR